ncbi:hypothetical protein N7461_003302 [Penicillium sp. DV-2018c]|nr:hypothetical protein N7461_003302 [Penicillium sp. DV-2018c]
MDNWMSYRGEFGDTEDLGWEDGKSLDLHYRTTVRESDALPREVVIGEQFIRPKCEIARGVGVPVNTLYKRKADKVTPMNVPLPDGSTPEGRPGWQEKCLRIYHSQPAPDQRTRFDKCARLTMEREERLIIGKDLLREEKELLRELLIKREGALAWSWEPILLPPRVTLSIR